MYASLLLLAAPLAAARTAKCACPGGRYASAAQAVSGYSQATSYCASAYPVTPKVSTVTATTTLTAVDGTATETTTAATVTESVTESAITLTVSTSVVETSVATTDSVETSLTTTTPIVTATATQTETETSTETTTTTVDYTVPAKREAGALMTKDPKAAAYSSLISQPSSFIKIACACIQPPTTTTTTTTVTSTVSATATATETATLTVSTTTTPISTNTLTETSTELTTTTILSSVESTVTAEPMTATTTTTTTTQTTATATATVTCPASAPNYCATTGACRAPGALNDRKNCGRCGLAVSIPRFLTPCFPRYSTFANTHPYKQCTGDDSCIDGVCKQPNQCFRDDFCSADQQTCYCYDTRSGNRVCYENGGSCGARDCQTSQDCPNGETCVGALGTNCCTTASGTALCPAPASAARMFRRAADGPGVLRLPFHAPASA